MKKNVIRLIENIHSKKMGRCSKLRKTEKLKKIQLLLNQKNLYEDQYERLLAATGDWKSNYTDYLITEPIDLVEELKRVPEADYDFFHLFP